MKVAICALLCGLQVAVVVGLPTCPNKHGYFCNAKHTGCPKGSTPDGEYTCAGFAGCNAGTPCCKPCIPTSNKKGVCTKPTQCCGGLCVGTQCCDATHPTPAPVSTGTHDDPWVAGMAGQNFVFSPVSEEDAWYAAISDPTLQVNLKLHKYDGVTTDDAEQEFYTGVSVQHFDEDGFATQSMLIEVRDETKFDFSCKDLDANAPEHCLGGGGVDVFLNGVRILEPGAMETGKGFAFAASNVPSACQYIADMQMKLHPQLATAQNRQLLAEFPSKFEDFLVDRPVRRPADCDRWIASAKKAFGDIFKAPGTKFTLKFTTPRTASVVEFDTHVPKDVSVRPMSFRIAYFLDGFKAHPNGSEGFIGETATVRYGKDGQPLMSGKVLKAADEDYKVDSPFGRDFKAKHVSA